MGPSFYRGKGLAVLAARIAAQFAHNVFAENDEQNNQGAKIQTEETAFQDNH